MGTGIVFLATLGIALVAFTVDLAAASLEHPAVAGLPLLAIYSVPAAVLPLGVPWIYFVLAALGFLVLVTTDWVDRVYAWGHPDGLEAGRNEDAFHDMIKSIEYAARIGAPVMRICASSFSYRLEPHAPQMDKLVPWLKEGAKVAESYGVKLAAENHIAYTSSEWLELLERVDSPYMGLNLDTGNFVRRQPLLAAEVARGQDPAPARWHRAMAQSAYDLEAWSPRAKAESGQCARGD